MKLLLWLLMTLLTMTYGTAGVKLLNMMYADTFGSITKIALHLQGPR